MRSSLPRSIAPVCVAVAAACGVDAGGRYDDFLRRADRTPPALPDVTASGAFADIGGKEYLLNIALNPLGDVELRLRMLVTRFEPDDAGIRAGVSGAFRFEDETAADPPVATFDTVLDDRGHMDISIGPVFVPADRSPVKDTAVEAEFTLATTVLDESSLCGRIDDEDSRVTQPLMLKLMGTTFGAEAFGPNGEPPADVPKACPGGG